ncbi:MAG: major capsid protein, partial [Nitrospiria bacterium]
MTLNDSTQQDQVSTSATVSVEAAAEKELGAFFRGELAPEPTPAPTPAPASPEAPQPPVVTALPAESGAPTPAPAP